MSDHSEDDIFEYRPLAKQKRKPVPHQTDQNADTPKPDSKRQRIASNLTNSRKNTNKKNSLSGLTGSNLASTSKGKTTTKRRKSPKKPTIKFKAQGSSSSPNKVGTDSSLGGFCPVCQMPLSIVIGSSEHHVGQCVRDYNNISFEGGRY